MDITIRKASKKDKDDILILVKALADFEKLEPPDEQAQLRLINDAFPGDNKMPKFYILLAQLDNRSVGYAFYFFTYSSFMAKPTLYLEDIFIREEFRNSGIGKLFMEKLKRIAKENNCSRFEWCVLKWNVDAINFYEKLGAKHLKEWLYYRINIIDEYSSGS